METITITRKITLYPLGDKEEVDRVYKYIRNGMEVQAQMMNQCISNMFASKMRKVGTDDIKRMSHLYGHIPTSKKGSAYEYDMEKYPTGLPLAGSIPRVCKQKFDAACKKGLMYGRVSLPSFKATMPLIVHNDYVNIAGSKTNSKGDKITTGLYHEYESPVALVEGLENDDNPLVFIKFANGIRFKVVFGNKHKSHELRCVFQNLFEGEYKICDSSIGFDKRTGKKIILNLSMKIPVLKNKLDENTVVGVDLGMAIPAVCALNNDYYKRECIGSYEDFTRQRVKIQSERRRIQKSLKDCSGGHGRNKKMAHLDKITLHEREFVKTYNHNVSRKVVDFAVKNGAKYINMENLCGIGKDERKEFVLRNWSYFELQTMIEYKAKRQGIEVRYINPAYTSQNCSVCGMKGERKTQAVFECLNPDCKCHTMYESFNADFNGARNIAQSTDFEK